MDNFNFGEINQNGKFIIVFDISYYISYLERISDLDDSFNDRELNSKTITTLIYSILNTMAHYRHYISSKRYQRNVVILYASNADHYDRYSKTFNGIIKYVNLFKKTFFIEKISNDSKYMYQHISYFMTMNIFLINSAMNVNSRVMYVGNNILATQMLKIDRNMIYISHNYINKGLDVFFKSKFLDIKRDTSLIDTRSPDFISTMISLIGFKHGFNRLLSIKNKRNCNIYNLIEKNAIDGEQKGMNFGLVKNLNLSIEDSKAYENRMRMIDIDIQNHIYKITKKIMKIWESSITTKSVYSLNDILQHNDIGLQINWILEY